jgi:hypothetical protein
MLMHEMCVTLKRVAASEARTGSLLLHCASMNRASRHNTQGKTVIEHGM